MKKIFVRTILTVFLPVILAWAFFSELFRELGRAFKYAWCEVLIEFETYRRFMKRDDYEQIP